MDYYGADRKLSELGEQDLEDFLDQDMFTPPSTCQDTALDSFGLVDTSDDTPMDNEWLDNFFDDPVLNDRMMTDALQPRRVQSEHSYSLTNGTKIIIDGDVKEEITEKDLEVDLLGSAINPNMTMTSGTTTSIINTTYIDTTSPAPAQFNLKHEPSFSQQEITMATNSIAPTPTPIAMTTMRTNTHPVHPQTLLKQPTIILATTQNSVPPLGGESIMPSIAPVKHERYVLPKVNIKVEPYDTASNMSSPDHSSESSYQGYECAYAESGVHTAMDEGGHHGHVQVMYDSIGLPPTPPSSSNSDSEGGLSPQRSAPPSPIRHSQLRQHTHTHHTLGGAADALFSSPIPTSGVLILSEEEKRTLVTEGYPIPNKLPLTKQEEKNLKKIRRKIKNKISAQESRRKKKEYLETLEKRVEAYNCENSDLKKKVENLESNNRSLLGQLQKLQSLVAKVPRPPTPSSSQTSTCLMVLVLSFAVFMGTWSSPTWSIGYSAMPAVPNYKPHSVIHGPTGQPIGPEIQEPVTDAYATPNMRSRVLLSLKEETEEPFGPYMPFTYNNFFSRWFSVDKDSCSEDMEPTAPEADYTINAPVPEVIAEVMAKVMADVNDTKYRHQQYVDISVNYTAQVMTHINTTAYSMVPDLAQNLS